MARKKNKKDFRLMLYTNLLLVLLLTASLFIFMLLLRPIMSHPEINKNIGIIIYGLIIILTIVTAVTTTMIFIILSKKRVV
ncbi:MAG: hypothetical protein ACTSVF_02935 [Candidatus Asgardarchaeia archaeon]